MGVSGMSKLYKKKKTPRTSVDRQSPRNGLHVNKQSVVASSERENMVIKP